MAKPHFSQCWVHWLKATVNGNRPNGDKNLTDAEAVCFTEEKKSVLTLRMWWIFASLKFKQQSLCSWPLRSFWIFSDSEY